MIERRTAVSMAVILSLSGCAGRVATSASGTRSAKPATQNIDVTSFIGSGDSAAIAQVVHRACRAAVPRSACYEAQLLPLAASGKVRLAMGSLNQLGGLDEDVRRTGHVYAHAIGIAAGKGRRDIAAAFTQCSESFQSGCYHGIIQAWFAGLDSIGSVQANALCEPFRADKSERWILFQCVHGMGHGLTMIYDHDLPKALAGCDLLNDWWDRHSCYSGAFMENIINVTNPHHPASALAHGGGKAGAKGTAPAVSGGMGSHSMHDMTGMDHRGSAHFKPVDPADQLYPCSILADRYQNACYQMQTSVMLYNNKGDIAAAARSCDTAPSAMRIICYSSLGRDISSYSAQNHTAAIRMCSLGALRYQPWCYFGLVKNIVDLNARPLDGIALCTDIPLPAGKVVCYAAVGEQISILGRDADERRKMCAPSEIEYLDACLYGSRVRLDPPPALAEAWLSSRP